MQHVTDDVAPVFDGVSLTMLRCLVFFVCDTDVIVLVVTSSIEIIRFIACKRNKLSHNFVTCHIYTNINSTRPPLVGLNPTTYLRSRSRSYRGGGRSERQGLRYKLVTEQTLFRPRQIAILRAKYTHSVHRLVLDWQHYTRIIFTLQISLNIFD